MVSTSSFASSSSSRRDTRERPMTGQWNKPSDDQGTGPDTVEVLLFPSFRHFKGLRPLPADPSPRAEGGNIKDFIRENLTPSSPAAPGTRSEADRDTATVHHWESSPITNPTILICSHGSRDSRCGVLGPVLHDEVRKYIAARRNTRDITRIELCVPQETRFIASGPEHEEPSLLYAQDQESVNPTINSDSSPPTHTPVPTPSGLNITINVGMISHVGGHKWAGNVIIYIPPAAAIPHSPARPKIDAQDTPESKPHPLAGMSIWYARVEPRHVEGIIEQTILKGNVIKDLFRGGLDHEGKLVRL